MKNITSVLNQNNKPSLNIKETTLNSSYVKEKIRNIDFKKTNIDKEYAYINICLSDYNNEKKCSQNQCYSQMNGYWNDFEIIDNKVFKTTRACHCLMAKKGKWATINNISLDYFDSKYHNTSFSDLQTFNKTLKVVKQYLNTTVKNFPEYTKPLILMGPSKSGKTFICSILANELFKKTQNIALLNLRNSLAELKPDNKLYFKSIKNRYINSSILFILNLGEEKNLGFTRDFFLYQVIKERIKNKKPTFFTTQYSYKQLLTKYSKNNKNVEAKMLVKLIENNFLPLILEPYKK